MSKDQGWFFEMNKIEKKILSKLPMNVGRRPKLHKSEMIKRRGSIIDLLEIENF